MAGTRKSIPALIVLRAEWDDPPLPASHLNLFLAGEGPLLLEPWGMSQQTPSPTRGHRRSGRATRRQWSS